MSVPDVEGLYVISTYSNGKYVGKCQRSRKVLKSGLYAFALGGCLDMALQVNEAEEKENRMVKGLSVTKDEFEWNIMSKVLDKSILSYFC